MEKEQISTSQEKKVEEVHWEIQQWKFKFQFMDDEIIFVYQPRVQPPYQIRHRMLLLGNIQLPLF